MSEAERQRYTWSEPPDPNGLCAYARDFSVFCQQTIAKLDRVKPADLPEAFVQVKSLLVDRYCDYLTDTPPRHTNAAKKRTHYCIDDVFKNAVKDVRQRMRELPPGSLVLGKASSEQPKRNRTAYELLRDG